MTNRIEGTVTSDTELDIKRTYLPGIKIFSECPGCGAECVVDMNHEYLSYPKVGQPEGVYFYHEHDENTEDSEWEVFVVLDLNLRLSQT